MRARYFVYHWERPVRPTTPGPDGVMRPPLVLYSTTTWLAFAIAERYYDGVHYAWCSPSFDGAAAPRHVNIPPSSSPAELYQRFREDSRRGEGHSLAFRNHKSGIRRGAEARRKQGVITREVEAEIRDIVKRVDVSAFRPVLYVIPFATVADVAIPVRVRARAHPLSQEYRLENLRRGEFDLLDLNG
jgi:hypothetical protein